MFGSRDGAVNAFQKIDHGTKNQKWYGNTVILNQKKNDKISTGRRIVQSYNCRILRNFTLPVLLVSLFIFHIIILSHLGLLRLVPKVKKSSQVKAMSWLWLTFFGKMSSQMTFGTFLLN